MTAWSANVSSSAISLVGERRDASARQTRCTPIGLAVAQQRDGQHRAMPALAETSASSGYSSSRSASDVGDVDRSAARAIARPATASRRSSGAAGADRGSRLASGPT